MGRGILSAKSDRLADGLPLEARLAHYRKLAADALLRAAHAETFSQRAGFVAMATGWHNLASEIESTMERFDTLEQAAPEQG